MTTTEDGEKYPKKETNRGMASGEKISTHFQMMTVIRINSFEPVKSEFQAANDW